MVFKRRVGWIAWINFIVNFHLSSQLLVSWQAVIVSMSNV